jgi:hypothetical protein
MLKFRIRIQGKGYEIFKNRLKIDLNVVSNK